MCKVGDNVARKQLEKHHVATYKSDLFYSWLSVSKVASQRNFIVDDGYEIELGMSPNDPDNFKVETKVNLENYKYRTHQHIYTQFVNTKEKLLKELRKLRYVYPWEYKDHSWIADIFFDLL